MNNQINMKLSKITKMVSLLIVGLGLVATVPSNAALRFNGTDSKAVLDGYYLDGTTHSSYTFEVWIKPFSLGSEACLFSKALYWKDWSLTIRPDGGLGFLGSWPNYYWGTGTATGSITTNLWQHICCAATNGQMSFYVNGRFVGTEIVQTPIDFASSASGGPVLDAPMAIGYGDSGTTPDFAFFNGLIYGIKVWNRTLTSNEVYSIATTGVPQNTNGLYNAVLLDEGGGTVIHDSLTPLTGRVLTAQWSGDMPTIVTTQSFLTNGLVAYYPFNGNANDASGNANHGVATNVTYGLGHLGVAGSAASFNGISSFVYVTNLFSSQPPQITYSIWFQTANRVSLTNAQFYLAGATGFTSDSGWDYGVGLNNPNPIWGNGPVIGDYNGFGMYKYVDWANYYYCDVTNFLFLSNEWHHVVAVFDGPTMNLYLDGIFRNTMQNHASGSQGIRNLEIGAHNWGSTLGIIHDQYSGLIDDVRVYFRALSSNEVQQLYQYESHPVGLPPIISIQPTNKITISGSNATFVVNATGTAPLIYQWQFNGANSSAATNSTLTLANVQGVNAGNYRVVVSNAYGMATSAVATLSLLYPPSITAQPVSLTNLVGTTASFIVSPFGTAPLAYQWQFKWANLISATNSSLDVTNVQVPDSGNYWIVITNAYGSITSAVAQLLVIDNLGPFMTISNLSGQVVDQRLYTLSGTATDANRGNSGVASVWINGNPVSNVTASLDTTATWNQTVALQQGLNQISVTAADWAGNMTTNRINVIFVPFERIAPTVAITAPRSPTYTNAVLITGTASDAKGVAEVWYRLNSGPWTLAIGTNKWSTLVTPAVGTNIVSAFAVDTSSNYSKTNSVKFVKIATDIFTIIRYGSGTITPNLNGQLLDIPKSYTLTATPGSGNFFSNCIAKRGFSGPVIWSTNKPAIKFNMESNLVLIVNFVTNNYLARKGDYAGLFCPSNEVFQADWTNSGSVKLTVTDKGTFTGQLIYKGGMSSISGALGLSGTTNLTLLRGKDPALKVSLTLDLIGNDGFTGTVSQYYSSWNASLWADLVLKQATKANYTLLAPTGPGNSYGGTLNLAVQPSGTIILSGTLSDSTRLTGSLPLTRQQEVPMNLSLYGGKGMWLGYVSLVGTNGGTAHWQKLTNSLDKVNPQAFSVNTKLLLP
ncbi:MAG: LamG-like jellyroll fold domain-containing protein [Verrucomicrobiota bacterium]